LQSARITPPLLGDADRPFKVTEIRVNNSTGDPDAAINFIVVSPSSGFTPMSVNIGLNAKSSPTCGLGLFQSVFFNDSLILYPYLAA
jgi:hypothetical protein